MVPPAKPIIGKEEKDAIIKVLDSGMLAQGEWVEEFERLFAKYIGAKYAVACSNGTTALHLALLALEIGKGDEVITTPFTFIATQNAILYTGAKPIFVDIEATTFNINPSLIRKKITKKTKAILPVHLFGLPANMPEVIKLAKKHRLWVVEDAAQAHGATIGNKKVGSFGNLACFSFYPTKNMTTGEGGMITTNSKRFAKKIKVLRNQGMKRKYEYQTLGYNYRMTNIAAAMGIEQLKKLDGFVTQRTKNACYLNKLLANSKIIIPFIPKGYKHVFNQYTIRTKKREKLIKRLAKNEIGNAIYYPKPLCPLPTATQISKEVLSLPIHPSVTRKDLDKIASIIID